METVISVTRRKVSLSVLQGIGRPDGEIKRPNREANQFSLSRFNVQHSMFDFHLHDPQTPSQHNVELWLGSEGGGGDLEANGVQGDVAIFGLWRDFSLFLLTFLFHSRYTRIQPKTRGVFTSTSLTSLLIDVEMHEFEGVTVTVTVSLSRQRQCRNICLPFPFPILGLL